MILWLLWSPVLSADDVRYVTAEAYIAQAFSQTFDHPLGGHPAKSQVFWVTGDLRPDVASILGRHNFPLRYRYYRRGGRTVWILDEIGKVMPITTGITIEADRIIDVQVLTYRESHGAEIRYPAFRQQFKDATLTEKRGLSKAIHGIAGATLSTNAMKRVTRLALYLHARVMGADHD